MTLLHFNFPQVFHSNVLKYPEMPTNTCLPISYLLLVYFLIPSAANVPIVFSFQSVGSQESVNDKAQIGSFV